MSIITDQLVSHEQHKTHHNVRLYVIAVANHNRQRVIFRGHYKSMCLKKSQPAQPQRSRSHNRQNNQNNYQQTTEYDKQASRQDSEY
jgi:hypothetical protein